MGLLGDIAGGILGGPAGAFLGSSNAMGNLGMDIVTGGAYSNTAAAQQMNQENINFAQKQMDFQQMNSNTAYQRAVQDMRAAGLNPMLAYTQGGASVPQGTTPNLTNPEPGNIGAGLANSAKSIIQGMPEVSGKYAQNENTRSSTELQNQQAKQSEATTQNLNVDNATKQIERGTAYYHRQKMAANAKESEANARKAHNDANQSDRDNAIAAKRYGFDKAAAKYDAVADRAGPIIKGVGETLLGKGLINKIGGAVKTNSTEDKFTPRYTPSEYERMKNRR